jgi:hypothetical protein
MCIVWIKHKSSTKRLAFSLSESSRWKSGVSSAGIHYEGVSVKAKEQWLATYISHIIQDTLIHIAMCLLCIPHAKDFPVCYSRGFFLDPRMLQSLDKVGFEYWCLACFKGLHHITFNLLAETEN